MKNLQTSKAQILDYYAALETTEPDKVADVIAAHCSDDCQWYGVHPFNEQHGSEAIAATFWRPFLDAFSSLQRRQDVFMAGINEIDGEQWTCSMGHFMGLFDQPWLGIPPTRRIAMIRYAEFNCVQNGKITRTGFHCDILSVMEQAGVYPLPPQTGATFIHPGPRTHDGLLFEAHDPADAKTSLALVNAMIADLDKLNHGGDHLSSPEFLSQRWHDDMVWYGPQGIGATYTIPRYQEQHQYPFRKNLTNKVFNGHICRFAEGNYCGFFGWPNLTNTNTGGFLGLPGNDIRADMRVVDVYRRDGDKLAENWVFIDLPYWLLQQGLDVLARMTELQTGQKP